MYGSSIWTAKQLATAAGCSREEVLQLLAKGKIRGQEIEGAWLIMEEDALTWLRSYDPEAEAEAAAIEAAEVSATEAAEAFEAETSDTAPDAAAEGETVEQPPDAHKPGVPTDEIREVDEEIDDTLITEEAEEATAMEAVEIADDTPQVTHADENREA